MQDSIPAGVIILASLAFALGLGLTWWRRDRYQGSGPARWWVMVEELILMTLMLITVFAAIVQLVVRFLLSDFVTVSWTEEFAILSMIWLAFVAAAALVRDGQHITFDLFYDVLPASARTALRILGEILAIVVFVPIAWSGYFNAARLKIMSTISLGVPVSVFAFAVPVLLTFMAGLAAFNLVKEIRMLLRRDSETESRP